MDRYHPTWLRGGQPKSTGDYRKGLLGSKVRSAGLRRDGSPFPGLPPLLCQQGFCPLHDLRRCHLEHLGKLEKRPERRAADASFQQADVRSIKAAIKGELLLRDVDSLAKFPQGFPEGPFRSGVGVDLLPRMLSGPLRQQSNGDMLRTIFPRNMFRIMEEILRRPVMGSLSQFRDRGP